jgi:hypothetical protein
LWHRLTTARPLEWASYIIAVAFLKPMLGMAFLRSQTTLGIEFFQSLCKTTFHGSSVRAFLSGRVPRFLSDFVVLMPR